MYNSISGRTVLGQSCFGKVMFAPSDMVYPHRTHQQILPVSEYVMLSTSHETILGPQKLGQVDYLVELRQICVRAVITGNNTCFPGSH